MKARLLLMLLLIVSIASFAQTKPKTKNTIVTYDGNFKERTDTRSDKVYTDKNGKIFYVYITQAGKYYIITGISEKTGKPKKKYLVF